MIYAECHGLCTALPQSRLYILKMLSLAEFRWFWQIGWKAEPQSQQINNPGFKQTITGLKKHRKGSFVAPAKAREVTFPDSNTLYRSLSESPKHNHSTEL